MSAKNVVSDHGKSFSVTFLADSEFSCVFEAIFLADSEFFSAPEVTIVTSFAIVLLNSGTQSQLTEEYCCNLLHFQEMTRFQLAIGLALSNSNPVRQSCIGSTASRP
jgi:hypothetical protein